MWTSLGTIILPTTIFKYSQNGYSYRPYLKCPKYETNKDNYDENGPTISLSLNRNYANPSFTYSITTTGDNKIISYSYEIYKSGVLVRDSGSVPVSREGVIEAKEVSLKELIPGNFKIVFKATNIYGFSSTETVSGSIVAEDAPKCILGTTNYTPDDWRRYDGPVEVTTGCQDTNGSGCAKEIFSQLFESDMGVNYIEIVDNAGVKNSCEVGVYIDNTSPSKPVLKNDYENTWINKDYTITATSKDDAAGIAYFQYRYPNSALAEEREWKTYANSSSAPGEEKTFETTPFSKERGEYVEIRACDYAGNCSEPSQSMIKIDKKAPNCEITKDGSGRPLTYKSSVTITLNINDPGQTPRAPISYGMANNNNASYNGITTATQGGTTGITWYGFIKDEAGNVNACDSGNFIVLRKVPAFTYTGTYKVVDDDNNEITDLDSWNDNWKIKFLTSGTLTINDLNGAENGIDVFLVGGGAGGGSSYWYEIRNGWGGDATGYGGGGGYTKTIKNVSIDKGTAYSIVIGSGGGVGKNGGASSGFGYTANGGSGKNGGSGGGREGIVYRNSGGSGGSNGSDSSCRTGYGQGTTTREFGEPTGALYSPGGGGGGSAAWDGGYVSGGSRGAGLTGTNSGAGGNGSGGGASGIVIIRNTRVVNNYIPKFTYTGAYEVVDDNDNLITETTTNWKIKFLSSGTLTITDLREAAAGIDIFLVGGGANGGGGGSGYTYDQIRGGDGGGGGYTTTLKGQLLSTNVEYQIIVGKAGEASSAFGFVANGGSGRNGGSIGGQGSSGATTAASGSSNGSGGQGTTTREFGESTGKLYAAGGGGGGGSWGTANGYGGAGGQGGGGRGGNGCDAFGEPGLSNTGSGGGGGGSWASGGRGGSGIVIIRNKR